MSTIPKYINIILLEKERYYIYISEEIQYSKILIECEIYDDYIKKYKPIKIIEQFILEDSNPYLIDSIVKKYMYKYGINNVKGGSYTDEYLSSSQIENIRKEFEFIENPYRFHSEMSDILIIYNNYTYNSLKQIEQLIQDISQNYQNYLFIKKIISTL